MRWLVDPFARLKRLVASHGEMPRGRGLTSGVVALALAVLCALAVAAFRFPAYLTTPELRAQYDVDALRLLMLASMIVAGGLSLANILLGYARWLSSIAFGLLVVTALAGGATVPVGDFADDTPYLGLDWLILDLFGSALIFVFIERSFPLRRGQAIFRAKWQTDLEHFAFNHLFVGFTLLVANQLVHHGLGWAVHGGVQRWVEALPFVLELLVLILVADLIQYWMHRAYHEVPILWRLHAVHHSVETMDWLAGSRMHVLELLATRILVLAPIFVLGFSKGVIDAYVVIVGFQAVFNHANVDVRLGPLSRVVVTPSFHHWHHSPEPEAIDRNYAAHFAFLDHLFGTAVKADRAWPERYGVTGEPLPDGFIRQQLYPFLPTGPREDAAGRS